MRGEESRGTINPWGNNQAQDYQSIFSEFGIDPISTVISELPEIPPFIRRGIVVGHRDYQIVARAIRDRTPYYVMTGFMPSGHPHLGHLMVMKEVVWHVRHGGTGYIAIADREAHAVRGISWEQCRVYGEEYLRCLYALGYEGTTYYQSENHALHGLAFEASTKVNFSELSAIYGFGPDTSLSHAESVITQVADILYPQVDKGPAPTVVPVGIDQDPHLRLTRGIAHKLRMFSVFTVFTTKKNGEPFVSIYPKDAPRKAILDILAAFPKSKEFGEHVEVYGHTLENVEEKVRKIELDHGGYSFFTPSSTYHIFMPGLQGGKMSSSVPESLFSFGEPDESISKRVRNALTGGRMTVEEQKRLGGEPDKCSVFLLNLFHLVEDDQELGEIRKACQQGCLLCGPCKKATLERVGSFLKDFRERMDAAQTGGG